MLCHKLTVKRVHREQLFWFVLR